MDQIVPTGAALPAVDFDVAMEVASHEALIRQTYKDGGGVLTWCVGMTNATGHKVERYIGKPQSLQHCMNVYAWALENYADHVRAVFGSLPKHQFAGILSWTWNLGGGALRKATWVAHFKAGRMKEAEASFKTWNKDNGKVIAGLTKRRAAEADLIFRGKWANDGTMTEYTQVTKAMTPVWSSATKINVTAELKAAFAKPAPVPMDRPKLPDAPVPIRRPPRALRGRHGAPSSRSSFSGSLRRAFSLSGSRRTAHAAEHPLHSRPALVAGPRRQAGPHDLG